VALSQTEQNESITDVREFAGNDIPDNPTPYILLTIFIAIFVLTVNEMSRIEEIESHILRAILLIFSVVFLVVLFLGTNRIYNLIGSLLTIEREISSTDPQIDHIIKERIAAESAFSDIISYLMWCTTTYFALIFFIAFFNSLKKGVYEDLLIILKLLKKKEN
jgi:hypothetical protein